jgi:23S rRNA A1618 N6-methylase RlmF
MAGAPPLRCRVACLVCACVLRLQLLMRAGCCGVCVRALLRLSRAFVATDVAPVALRWAARNVAANPQLAHLIQARARSSAACSVRVRVS